MIILLTSQLMVNCRKMNFENANWPCDWRGKVDRYQWSYGRSKGHSCMILH
jgi:hypothetical protein